MRADRRELLVLRHAKSSWDDASRADRDRPLAPRGRRDAPRMGRWLRDHDLVPDRVLSSPAARARETVEAVVEALGGGIDVHLEERIYLGSAGELRRVLVGCPAACRRVLLVGHNPGLEDLVRELVGGAVEEPADGKLLPTAALARLAVRGTWSALGPGTATLVEIVRPRALAR